ncbi:Alpha/Beta hydrolase protein [Crucibulum laeve]|uniref:Alpha/Beta hydrolase protein n=1 Tax=Crucibulum laeve TaxID=68775 RepID=A0A5C3LHT9_9AGAR|nr:Alpha/Beta hydrolase protein [Crucibulum laeve]
MEDRAPISAIIVDSSRSLVPAKADDPSLVVFYLQGNAGNPLHRLPVFQALLSNLPSSTSVKIFAAAPRSYWHTPGSPTQEGILSDYTSCLYYSLNRWPDAKVVLYGHSLGGAVSVCLLARLQISSHDNDKYHPPPSSYNHIQGLILENPFASVPGMLQALYPQKWVPYQYLAPFVLDRWDAAAEIILAEASVLARLAPDLLILLSEHDEIVPTQMGEELFDLSLRICDQKANTVGKGPRKVTIPGALHDNAFQKRAWGKEMGCYLSDLVKMK